MILVRCLINGTDKYYEGYGFLDDKKGFYTFRVKGNGSTESGIEKPVILNGIHGDFVQHAVENLDINLFRFPELFIEPVSVENVKEEYIKFIGPSFHPIIALSYEIKDELSIDLVSNLAINLLENDLTNDRELITYICEYLWEVVNNNPKLEYKEYYKSLIIQEYVQAQNLVQITFLEDSNLEIYERQPSKIKFPKEKVNDFVWAMNFIKANKRDGVEREAHNGPNDYHIHYVVVRGGRAKRTNKMLTFQPDIVPNILYWQEHNEEAIEESLPNGEKKKKKIYESCCECLKAINKENFRKPDNQSQVYYP
ncbi:hypothetical protein [Priestia megaterium]|uniref:hypothetical protein n=1 Tax=Priestia megaterium TaxID=1404 RepID=UPI000BFE41B0|nr:hypothetical protein [Priestia megaterium]PGY51517.1 hypothetical protein COE35_13585 [Priestia megaterium]